MRTVRQALIDEVFYPLADGKVDNVLLLRDIDSEAEVTKETLQSDAFQGALADCLTAVIEQAVNFSEADKSVNVPTEAQIKILKTRVNAIYTNIGEETQDFDEPTVTFGL